MLARLGQVIGWTGTILAVPMASVKLTHYPSFPMVSHREAPRTKAIPGFIKSELYMQEKKCYLAFGQ
jgi:hypothetical protein